jgi:cell wall-associated NlpC family hydrolase
MQATRNAFHRTPRNLWNPLLLVLLCALAGCSSTPSQRDAARPDVRPDSRPDRPASEAPSPIASRLTVEAANDVTLYAISLVGTPYRWGGNTPASGFDCSGLIGHVYKTQAGILAPRTTAALVDWGQPVPAASLRSGDVVVFAQRGTVNHAGIYVGEGRFVHAPSTGGEVRLDSLSSVYWAKQPVTYRRP